MTEKGTFWASEPTRDMGNLDAWKASCAECHTLNWNPDDSTFAFSETEPEKGLNIQCENCHGPYVAHSATNPAMDLDYAHESCVECHSGRQVEDHLNSRHSQSYEDLQPNARAFEEKINCTFSVNYIFPGPTETICLVLDTDQITVLGYEELSLDGTGIATVKIEIPLPETPGKWLIAPSVYWLSGDAPTYSEISWKKELSFDVLDVDPGHSQGTCGEESVKCHGN